MRTTEAARYARLSVTVAALLAAMVAGVYGWRAWEARRAKSSAPSPVPEAVQQQSAEFTFSKVDGNNTRFILRAAHATEFKDRGRTVLDDVWITAFGGNGKRADQLRTPSCEYLADSGIVTCPQRVLIDLQSNEAAEKQGSESQPARANVHIVTSKLNFNRTSGIATTEEQVEFEFPEGNGRARGLRYDSDHGELRLLHDVELTFHSFDAGGAGLPGSSGSDPTVVSSDELLFMRNERRILLTGNAIMHRSDRELRSGRMTMELDASMNATRFVANGKPVLRSSGDGSTMSLEGDEVVAPLATKGQLSGIFATGHVVMNASRTDGTHHLTSDAASFDLVPETQQLRHFAANGNVKLLSVASAGAKRTLQATQLDVVFAPVGVANSRVDHATAAAGTMEWEAMPSKTAAPDEMRLKGQTLDGVFDDAGVLRELRANGNVEARRSASGQSPTTTMSRQLLAKIAADGSWSTMDQTGDVRLHNASGDARGDSAHFDHAADSVVLSGSVVLSDQSSQTRARTATFLQGSSRLHTEGGVSTIERADPDSATAGGAAEPMHITASEMSSDTASGRAVYSGDARIWQGDSVIQADAIDLDRSSNTLVATGHVSAMLRRTPSTPSSVSTNARKSATGSSPAGFWRAEGKKLTYQEGQHRLHLEDQATARTAEGKISADQLDFVLEPATPAAVGTGKSGRGPRTTKSLDDQQVQSAQGLGNVRVESEGRIGRAERADYSAAEGKFVLSGGRPSLIDKFGNSTAGRELTFFFSSDTIIVDSEDGSRTITLHRVEK